MEPLRNENRLNEAARPVSRALCILEEAMTTIERLEVGPAASGARILIEATVPLLEGPLPSDAVRRENQRLALAQIKAVLLQLIPLLAYQCIQSQIGNP